MSIYSRQRRFAYSLGTIALLTAVYVGFRLVSNTFLDVERRDARRTYTNRSETSDNEAIQLARTWFPKTPWVGRSRKQFFHEGRFLYCQELSLINDDRSMKLTPAAVLWQNEDEEKRPITLVADSAQLTSTDPFSLNATKFGKITGGLINGNVRIEGPDNLLIEGRSFQLDHNSMKLFSSDQVYFRFDTHEGIAPGGVDIYLVAAKDSDGSLADVDHISEVQLHGRVSCKFFIPARKPKQKDVRLKIMAAGGLKFDVDMKICTFSGLSPDGRGLQLNPMEEVWVRRVQEDGTVDEDLVCPELQLHFRNRVDRITGQPLEDKLTIERLTAWGRAVTVASKVHNLSMQGTELHYALDEGRFDLKHSDLDTSEHRKMVRVDRDGMTLQVPHVRVFTTEDQGLQRVECLGKGRLFGHVPDSKQDDKQAKGLSEKKKKLDSRFLVSWQDELTFRKRDLEHWLVDIQGSAAVHESSRKLQLKGDQIQVLLSEQSQPEADEISNFEIQQIGHSAAIRPPDLTNDFELAALQPELITAAGNVSLKTTQGSGVVRDRLVIKLTDNVTSPTASEQSDAKNPSSSDRLSDEDELSGVTFETDRLEAVVNRSAENESDSQGMQLQSVWLKGGVKIDRKSDDPQEAFTAEGTILHVATTAAQKLKLHLSGDPARLKSANRDLEGPRIDLTEVNSHAEVVGSGLIRFYTDKGFDGKLLPSPAPLDIYWSDQMSFEKRSATFVGNIRISMSDEEAQDVEILCSGLKVFFSRDITLGKTEADGAFQALDGKSKTKVSLIERIECMNQVTVRIDGYEEGQQAARHHIEAADLKMNWISGQFHAVGPGFLESVSPDREGRLQGAAPVTVRPNRPATISQTAFVYVKADFIGDIRGNIHDRVAALNQNVVVLVAPAPGIDERVSLDLIPVEDLPERAGLLRADQVTLSMTKDDAFSLIARNNARLESQALSASADVITYDHQKQQFIIRTEGDNEVIAVHRTSPDHPGNRLKGKRFEYYPRSKQLKADGIGGLQIDN